MIEKKIELQKDNVTKSVDENLVSMYLNMGWSKVDKQKEIAEKVISKKGSKSLFKKD